MTFPLDPEALGFSVQKLARITAWYQNLIDSRVLPGAVVAIARYGRLAYLGALGYQDRAKTAQMAIDTIFWIASMTKPVTSAAAMGLVEQAKLDLNRAVSDYLPEFATTKVSVEVSSPDRPEVGLILEPPKRPMLVLDLLRHTAGLVYGGGADSTGVHRLYRKLYDEGGVWNRSSTLAEFTRALAEIPLAHHPGDVWEYSHAVDVLARVVEIVANEPLSDYLDRCFFEPLGMADTAFEVAEAKLTRLADPPPGGRDAVWDVTRPTSLHSGGGGLVSTALDYLRFCHMLLDGGQLDGVRVLLPETVARIASNSLTPSIRFASDFMGPLAGATWGLGFAIRSDPIFSQYPGSTGSISWGGVWGTNFWIDFAERVVALQLIQVPPGTGAYYRTALGCLVNEALIDRSR
jgi:CubicO group peptidase (beta-lactamase class C family)